MLGIKWVDINSGLGGGHSVGYVDGKKICQIGGSGGRHFIQIYGHDGKQIDEADVTVEVNTEIYETRRMTTHRLSTGRWPSSIHLTSDDRMMNNVSNRTPDWIGGCFQRETTPADMAVHDAVSGDGDFFSQF